MKQDYKKIAAKCAREGKTKLELMMLVPKATLVEIKQINLFFEMSQEILKMHRANEREDVLRRVILRMGFDEDDLDLILGKKELRNILISYGLSILSLIFVLAVIFVAGNMFLSTLSNTDWKSLDKCVYWGDYPVELSKCLFDSAKLHGQTKTDVLNFVLTLEMKNKDLGIVYLEFAKYYEDIDLCYSVFSKDYNLGVSCIKNLDSNKLIPLTKNILNILDKGLSDSDLSFTLLSLAKYYSDSNYCTLVPILNSREGCFELFPKPLGPIAVRPILCGNGVIDGKEKCDGNNFNGLSCESLGFSKGKLFCVGCQLNKSGCYNVYTSVDLNDKNEPVVPKFVCGNKIRENNEDCDGLEFGGLSCDDYGFNSGNLSCNNCQIDYNACTNVALQVCGNGILEGTEQCEGTNLNGRTCESYGYTGGKLGCNNCQLVTKACTNEVALLTEIDPLKIFDCPYNPNYSSPIRDNANKVFWIKVIKGSKIMAFKVPFNKSACGEGTALRTDENGGLIPCVVNLNYVPDVCITERREVGTLSGDFERYIELGKYGGAYKQNPVDFIGTDGNIYFLIKSEGKTEFIKFSPFNYNYAETIPVFEDSDYLLKSVPIVMRAVPSGKVLWLVLGGALNNVYLGKDTNTNFDVCINAPFMGSSGAVEFGWNEYAYNYGLGTVFIGKNYSGKTISKVNLKVYCEQHVDDIPNSGGMTIGYASMKGFNFNPTQMTYAGDGYGNLVVRTNKKILEYSINSNDVNYPSVVR
jgi:hypothetical protein